MSSPWEGSANAPVTTDTPPAGLHRAVLVGIVDIGTHDGEYKGQKNTTHRCLLVWELLDAEVPAWVDLRVFARCGFYLDIDLLDVTAFC